jgi:patatin-like phospholipase/acyl hydrolase
MAGITLISCSGGGIRGIASLRAFEAIEKSTGQPIHTIGDHFAGTSTGSIITCLLLSGKYTASECIDLYTKNASLIFSRNPFHLGNLLGAKYRSGGIEKCLKEYFGNMRMSDLLRPCIIPAYDMVNNCVKLFRNTDNDLVRDVCRASSAAPTYFPPHNGLIDGGIAAANNPSSILLAECGYENVRLISIGTGERKQSYSPKDKTILQWGSVIVNMILDASEEEVTFFCSKKLGPDYFAWNTDLGSASEQMDDVSTGNIQALLNIPLDTTDLLKFVNTKILV